MNTALFIFAGVLIILGFVVFIRSLGMEKPENTVFTLMIAVGIVGTGIAIFANASLDVYV